MASPLPENWGCTSGADDNEVPEIDAALLTSFLDESYDEDGEDSEEKIRSVMQSLEAEISPGISCSHDSGGKTELFYSNLDQDHQGINDTRQIDHLTAASNLDFNWIDMDMAPSPSADGAVNWSGESYGDDTGSMMDIGEYKDHSQFNCYGNASEEQQGYGSLWQDTYDSTVMSG